LDKKEVYEIIDISLFCGRLLLQYGAETKSVEDTVKAISSNLGLANPVVVVLPYSILITINYNGEFFTKIDRAERQEVNFKVLSEIYTIYKDIENGNSLNRTKILSRLRHIHILHKSYPKWLMVLAGGFACSALSIIFGANFIEIFITFIASIIGLSARFYLHTKHLNPFLVVVIASFISSLIALYFVQITHSSNIPITSSILFLVPGVPLINSAEDLIKGHFINALSRGIRGFLVTLGIAIGIVISTSLLN